VAILDAMKNRRTYASLDKNIQCQYTVNGSVMGSTLKAANDFTFDIAISEWSGNQDESVTLMFRWNTVAAIQSSLSLNAGTSQ